MQCLLLLLLPLLLLLLLPPHSPPSARGKMSALVRIFINRTVDSRCATSSNNFPLACVCVCFPVCVCVQLVACAQFEFCCRTFSGILFTFITLRKFKWKISINILLSDIKFLLNFARNPTTRWYQQRQQPRQQQSQRTNRAAEFTTTTGP